MRLPSLKLERGSPRSVSFPSLGNFDTCGPGETDRTTETLMSLSEQGYKIESVRVLPMVKVSKAELERATVDILKRLRETMDGWVLRAMGVEESDVWTK